MGPRNPPYAIHQALRRAVGAYDDKGSSDKGSRGDPRTEERWCNGMKSRRRRGRWIVIANRERGRARRGSGAVIPFGPFWPATITIPPDH